MKTIEQKQKEQLLLKWIEESTPCQLIDAIFGPPPKDIPENVKKNALILASIKDAFNNNECACAIFEKSLKNDEISHRLEMQKLETLTDVVVYRMDISGSNPVAIPKLHYRQLHVTR